MCCSYLLLFYWTNVFSNGEWFMYHTCLAWWLEGLSRSNYSSSLLLALMYWRAERSLLCHQLLVMYHRTPYGSTWTFISGIVRHFYQCSQIDGKWKTCYMFGALNLFAQTSIPALDATSRSFANTEANLEKGRQDSVPRALTSADAGNRQKEQRTKTQIQFIFESLNFHPSFDHSIRHSFRAQWRPHKMSIVHCFKHQTPPTLQSSPTWSRFGCVCLCVTNSNQVQEVHRCAVQKSWRKPEC